jgi:hypothetical protein
MPGSATAAAGWPRLLAWAMFLAAVVAVAWLVTGLLRQCTPVAAIQGGGAAAQGIVREGGEQVRATLRTFADVLRPTIVNSPLVVLRGDDATPKLVVFTHLADVTVDERDAHWYGDTYARIEAKNCRVQFIVPVDRMKDSDVMLVPGMDGEPARIVVLAPRPRVDSEMLAIAPESIEFTERNTGLRYARSWLGLDNRDQLVRQLRPRLLEAVSSPAVRAKAEAAARAFFEERFAEWLRSDLRLGRDVVVDVRWTE